jgi:hypothetical protein
MDLAGANKRPGVDAGWAGLFAFLRARPRATQAGCWASSRADRIYKLASSRCLFNDMRHYLPLLIGLALLPGCTRSTKLPSDFRPDYGLTVYQTSRPITGESVSLPLGHTGFRGVVSAMRYTDKNDKNPDFCFISVEYGNPGKEDGATVCYQRQFPVSSVSASVLTSKAKDVIFFDSSGRQVTFRLGPTNYTYALPQTQ